MKSLLKASMILFFLYTLVHCSEGTQLHLKLSRRMLHQNPYIVDLTLINNSDTTMRYLGENDSYFFYQFSFIYNTGWEEEQLGYAPIYECTRCPNEPIKRNVDIRTLKSGKAISFNIDMSNYRIGIMYEKSGGNLRCHLKQSPLPLSYSKHKASSNTISVPKLN